MKDQYWADLADATDGMHLRDVQALEDRRERARSKTQFTFSETGPLARPLTEGWAMYKRFKPNTEFVSVVTLQGKQVELTRNQADVLDVARTLIGQHISYAVIAKELDLARSTVYRALVKLSSYGLIGYITAKGRGGTIILSRGKGDPFDRLQRAAQATVKRWADATKRRFERMRATVATYVFEEGRRGNSLSDYFLVTSGRNSQGWTPEELREVGII